VQHLRPEVGHLAHLAVGQHGDHLGVRGQARVGGHHAVHVGPNPHFGAVHIRAQQGSAVIAAAAPQRRHHAVARRADEAGHYRHQPLVEQRQQLAAHGGLGFFEEHARVLELVIGDDQAAGADRVARHPTLAQPRRDDGHAHALAQRANLVHRFGRRLAQHVDAVAQRLELINERFHFVVDSDALHVRRQQRADGRLVLLAQGVGDGLVARAVAGSGGLRALDQQVGHAAHRRADHQHAISARCPGNDVHCLGNRLGAADGRSAELHGQGWHSLPPGAARRIHKKRGADLLRA